jgi:hypothetical protein
MYWLTATPMAKATQELDYFQKIATDDTLILYGELTAAQKRAVQRRLKSGELQKICTGMVSSRSQGEWPALIARMRSRVLAALFPGAVISYRSAFKGGIPVDGVIHLAYSYDRTIELPGLKVVLVKAPGPADGDTPIAGSALYFASKARVFLENLTVNRGAVPKALGRHAVEKRLRSTFEVRGEEKLVQLREAARTLAPTLGFDRQWVILDEIFASILNRTPSSGHHDLLEALSTAGRFGRLRRTGNRPAVDNALTATAPSPPGYASESRTALA